VAGALRVPRAVNGGGRLAVVPAPLVELVCNAGSTLDDDDRAIVLVAVVCPGRNAQGDRKAVVVGPRVRYRFDRIGSLALIDVGAIAVIGVDVVEAAFQQTDRAGVISVREDGAAADRPVMSAFLRKKDWRRCREAPDTPPRLSRKAAKL
jgi:hypothetical protein